MLITVIKTNARAANTNYIGFVGLLVFKVSCCTGGLCGLIVGHSLEIQKVAGLNLGRSASR